MNHGTLTAYTGGGCRCPDCRAAMRDYQRDRRFRRTTGRSAPAPLPIPTRCRVLTVDEQNLRDLLIELCPDGLTDDCPARQHQQAA